MGFLGYGLLLLSSKLISSRLICLILVFIFLDKKTGRNIRPVLPFYRPTRTPKIVRFGWFLPPKIFWNSNAVEVFAPGLFIPSTGFSIQFPAGYGFEFVAQTLFNSYCLALIPEQVQTT